MWICNLNMSTYLDIWICDISQLKVLQSSLCLTIRKSLFVVRTWIKQNKCRDSEIKMFFYEAHENRDSSYYMIIMVLLSSTWGQGFRQKLLLLRFLHIWPAWPLFQHASSAQTRFSKKKLFCWLADSSNSSFSPMILEDDCIVLWLMVIWRPFL